MYEISLWRRQDSYISLSFNLLPSILGFLNNFIAMLSKSLRSSVECVDTLTCCYNMHKYISKEKRKINNKETKTGMVIKDKLVNRRLYTPLQSTSGLSELRSDRWKQFGIIEVHLNRVRINLYWLCEKICAVIIFIVTAGDSFRDSLCWPAGLDLFIYW